MAELLKIQCMYNLITQFLQVITSIYDDQNCTWNHFALFAAKKPLLYVSIKILLISCFSGTILGQLSHGTWQNGQ